MGNSLTIDRYRKQLTRIVATLFAMAGIVESAAVDRLSKPVYLTILRLLRPAESAVRRLIVVAARGVLVKPPKARSAPAKPVITSKSQRLPRNTFRLFDPRQRFSTSVRFRSHPKPFEGPPVAPRLRVLDVGYDPRIPMFRATAAVAATPPAIADDNTVSARRLCRRLAAIRSALDDLPRQARRYARWLAKPHEARRPKLASALRPGHPPGHRKNPIHKVDEILAECDWLARRAPLVDTS